MSYCKGLQKHILPSALKEGGGRETHSVLDLGHGRVLSEEVEHPVCQLRRNNPSSLPAKPEGHGAEDGGEERRLGDEKHEANWHQLYSGLANLPSSRE